MKHIILALTLTLFGFLTLPAHAETVALKTGDTIPMPFELTDHKGTAQTFDSLKGEKGLVLAFTRSIDWCPYCQAQVKDINSRLNDFKTKGYHVAVASYDAQEKTQKFVQKNNITFPLLSDTESKMIRAFGIMMEGIEPYSDFYGIPQPTIYVMNTDGVITHIFTEENYKNRPKLDDVVAALGK